MDTKLKIFYELYERRRSARDFVSIPVENEKMERILEAARRAPSAANCQPWRFILLPLEKRNVFNREVLKEKFHRAPLIIVACVDSSMAWVRKADGMNYGLIDVTIAVTEMITVATAEGIGTCWIGSFDPDKVKKMLSIPKEIEIVGMLALGYTEKPLQKEQKVRKGRNEIFFEGKWGK